MHVVEYNYMYSTSDRALLNNDRDLATPTWQIIMIMIICQIVMIIFQIGVTIDIRARGNGLET